MSALRYAVLAAAAVSLVGCAVAPPTGPDVVVLPGKDKTFEAFQADDAACRQFASTQIGNGSPSEAASQSALGSATLGTLLGAAAGAAIGAATGNPAAWAAIGGGSGLFLGGTTGLGAAEASRTALQRRYDMSYLQCMSAKGENVPNATAYPVYPSSYYSRYYDPYYPPFYGSVFLGFGFHSHHFRRTRFHRFHHLARPTQRGLPLHRGH